MKKIFTRLSVLLIILILLLQTSMTFAVADAATVESVTEQLEAIDTLQEMQDRRYQSPYTVNAYYTYNRSTTDQTRKETHLAKQAAYANYLSSMNAARTAAQEAYDSLSDEQKAQIDPALVAKLDNTLETTVLEGPFKVTPTDDLYPYEIVQHGLGFGYECSNYGVADTLPQTFVVVDTRETGDVWDPNTRLYEPDESNFEVAYCADFETGIEWGSHYKRMNLEDASYFDDSCAEKVRAIIQKSYPYVSIEEMKEILKEDGLDPAFVDSLNRSDMIAAVQMAVWQYTNYDALTEAVPGYCASISVPKNSGIWFTAYHDFSNELWDWFPGKRTQTFNDEAEYRVNNLYYHLIATEGVKAGKRQTIISDIEVGRLDLIPRGEDLYSVGLQIKLNAGCTDKDDVILTVASYSEDGTQTGINTVKVGEETEYVLAITAKYGDTIKVTAEGTQELEKGVYFYDARGGRDVSQSLVSVASGDSPVAAAMEFTFEEDVETGIRVYKKSTEDMSPISDITFNVYKVETNEGEQLNETPTADEIVRFATEENLVGTMVTDVTGYATLSLPGYGTYLVVEEHNAEKVVAPADPFYVTLPWAVEEEVDGEKVINYYDVVEVYPKNTPIVPPPPPPPPPPERVNGKFKILKYDNNNATDYLAGAEFQLYRAATDEDTETEKIYCNGLTCSVVPVYIDGDIVTLVTGSDGIATSPDLDCGTYFIKETKAPFGYVLPKESHVVTVQSSVETEIAQVSVGNDRGIVLPATGGSGTLLIITVGGLLVLIGIALIIIRKRASQY